MSQPQPSNGVSPTTRGLRHPPRQSALPLNDVTARLAIVALIAYERHSLLELPVFAVRPHPDVTMSAIIGTVYADNSSLQGQWEAYRADYLRLTEALAVAAARWVPKALIANLSTLDRFAAEVFADENPRQLLEAARVYNEWVVSQRSRYTEYVEGARNYRRVEIPAKRRMVEQEALERADNRHLRILFGHPDRRSLFADLAKSEEDVREALAEVLAEAREGIADFQKELQEDPERFWRYPPIVLAALRELNLRVAPDPLFVRFLLDVARHRSVDWWDLTSSVAGTAVVAAAFVVTGGWGAVLIGLVDLGVSGFSAYRAYLGARENEMAVRAGVFGQGQVLTDRRTSYGPTALEIAATIITGLDVAVGTLRVVRGAAARAESASAILSRRVGHGEAATGAETRAIREKATGGLGSNRAASDRRIEPQLPSQRSDELPERPPMEIESSTGRQAAADYPSNTELIEPPVLVSGEKFTVERLTDNTVGEVKTRRSHGLQRSEGGHMLEGRSVAEAKAGVGTPSRIVPPSGVYATERFVQGEPRLVIHAWLGVPKRRARLEDEMMSAANYGIQELASYQRAHPIGAGLGAEASEGIRLAPEFVNQALQNRSIEAFLRDLIHLTQGEQWLHLTTVVETHPRTLRLASIHYLVSAKKEGSLVTLFEAAIEVQRGGVARPGVRLPGSDMYTWGPWTGGSKSSP